MATLTQEKAHQLFEYTEDGLIRKFSTARLAKKGQIAGYINDKGYKKTLINGKEYGVHQIVFLMHYGYIPKLIDHVDRNPLNNKIENLREATKTQNNLNSKIRSDNSSGVKNVSWHSQKSKWQVRLCINKKSKSFGMYDQLELAELVAQEARDKYFGKFAFKGV